MEDFYSQAFDNNNENISQNQDSLSDNELVQDSKETAVKSVAMPSKMIIDDEKQAIVDKRSDFDRTVDEAKVSFLKNQSGEYVEEFHNALADATVEKAKAEKEKAITEKEKIRIDKELALATQRANKWDNREKRRLYHYNGVKPIMEFVNIDKPMNLPFLYLMTVILFIPFLFDKLLKATFGNLIAGATNDDRPKAVKGVLWTAFGIAAVFLLALGILLLLEWLSITNFIK